LTKTVLASGSWPASAGMVWWRGQKKNKEGKFSFKNSLNMELPS